MCSTKAIIAVALLFILFALQHTIEANSWRGGRIRSALIPPPIPREPPSRNYQISNSFQNTNTHESKPHYLSAKPVSYPNVGGGNLYASMRSIRSPPLGSTGTGNRPSHSYYNSAQEPAPISKAGGGNSYGPRGSRGHRSSSSQLSPPSRHHNILTSHENTSQQQIISSGPGFATGHMIDAVPNQPRNHHPHDNNNDKESDKIIFNNIEPAGSVKVQTNHASLPLKETNNKATESARFNRNVTESGDVAVSAPQKSSAGEPTISVSIILTILLFVCLIF